MPTESGEQSLSEQTVSGLSWQMLASTVRLIAQFGIGVVLARLLPPEDFGIVGLAFIASGFASILTDLGLGPAIIQREELLERHIRVSHTASLLAAVAMGGMLYGGAGEVASFFNEPRVASVLQVLAFTFPFTGFGITAGALLTRRLAFGVLVKIELVSSIIGYGGVAVGMAATGFGYWSLVGGTFVQAVFATLLKYAVVRHDLRPLLAREEIYDLLGFSTGMSLTTTVNYFARQGDYFVVGRLMDATSLGFYSRAYSLMQLPLSFFGQALSRVLFPAASRVQDDPERFQRAFLTTFFVSVSVSLPGSLSVAILAPEIVLILYGEMWTSTIPLLQIIALFGAFRMSYNTATAFLRARGLVYQLLFSQVIYGALVVGGSWAAGAEWGLVGVSWAVGGAIVAMWAIVTGFAVRAAGVSPPQFSRDLANVVVPALLGSLALLGIVEAVRALAVPQLAVLLIAGMVGAFLTLWCLIHTARRLDHPTVNARIKKVIKIVMQRDELETVDGA